MSGLLKAGQAARDIRAFTALRPSTAPTVAPRSAVELALDDAQAEMARLRTTLIEMQAQAERDGSDAYAAGVADGKATADDATTRRIELLEAMLTTVRADWDTRLDGIDALAVELARAGLAKLFAQSGDLGDLVARAIALKLAALRAESVVAIVVSERDFADHAARDVLRARIASVGTALVSDPALPAGACRLDLKLGHIDLSVDTLAHEIDDALANLVRAGRGA